MKPRVVNSVVLTLCSVLAVALFASAEAADVSTWRVNKHQEFIQTSSGTPVFKSSKPYEFEAVANGTGPFNVVGLTVKLPNNVTKTGQPYPEAPEDGYAVVDQFTT